MRPVTLRNVPTELAQAIRRRAEERRTSINKAIISLLEEGNGERKVRRAALRHDLDHLAGAWSSAEAAAFDRSLTQQRAVDPELWT